MPVSPVLKAVAPSASRDLLISLLRPYRRRMLFAAIALVLAAAAMLGVGQGCGR